MKLADFNLVDIEVKESMEPHSDNILRALSLLNEDSQTSGSRYHRKTIDVYSVYKNYDGQGNVTGTRTISYNLEYEGTRKMMHLALTMLASYKQEVTILIDEFDKSFHLSLSKSVIKLINSIGNKNQFILSSHNLSLLDCDLRVDQIYLVEKRFNDVFDLFSLFDIKDISGYSRNDISFVKRYLDGHFGALPDVDLEGLEELLGNGYG